MLYYTNISQMQRPLKACFRLLDVMCCGDDDRLNTNNDEQKVTINLSSRIDMQTYAGCMHTS